MTFHHFSCILYILAAYLVAGRKAAIPAGIILLPRWYVVMAIVFAIEVALIILYSTILRFGFEQIIFLRFIGKIIARKKEKIDQSRVVKYAKKYGNVGILLVSLIGGIIPAVLLARSLKLERWKSYLFQFAGSIIACLIFSLGVGGIKEVILKMKIFG